MKGMQSIQWKLIGIYNVIVLIAMIVSGVFILWQLEEYEYGKIENDIISVTNNFMEVDFTEESEEEVLGAFKDYLEKNTSYYSDKNTEVYILDDNGKYFYSSIIIKEDSEETSFSTKAIISATNGISKIERLNENADQEMMAYAFPFIMDEDVKAIIYIKVFTGNVADTMEKSKNIILISLVVAMLLSILTGFVFSKTITDPIKALTTTAKKMAKGEINQTMEVKGDDEIGQLTKTFNYMSVELNKTLKDISNEKNKLEAVFEHMQDGIITFNTQGNLIHANATLYKILGILKQIEKVSQLNKILGTKIDINKYKSSRNSELKTEEIYYEDKILNVVIVNYLNDKYETEGIIIMVQDVTEQRKLDNMRKEFVANVSHELRTPLTTVKGYVETLIDGVDDKNMSNKFLKVINNEADRMTFLVKDLLELSRFDNRQIKFDMVSTDIYELVNDVCMAQRIQAENKNQTLKSLIPSGKLMITVDPNRISQVITNILSNAIKYSEEKAKITVTSKIEQNKVYIVVKDTGMGIPKEDLPRIFERFYRVDKARSRSMGGTGLGLAIAKEIMQAHGGDIYIESIYKTGTTAYIVFPYL